MDRPKHDKDSSSDSDVEHAPNSSAIIRHANTSKTTTNYANGLLTSASDKAGIQNIDQTRINDAILLRELVNLMFLRRQRKMND